MKNENKKIYYKELISLSNLKDVLKCTKNNVSPVIDGEVKQEITEKRLSKLYDELASQKYKLKPGHTFDRGQI